MKGLRWITILVACGSLFAAGCGKKVSETTEHTEEGEEGGGGVAFKEGRGLALNPDVAKALGLATVEVEEGPLAAEMKLLAQVFATTPQILASASMTEAEAERLEKQSFTGAKLVRLDRAAFTATRRLDGIFAIDRSPAPQIGEFVELALTGEAHSALVVPRSAILDTAVGPVAYVVNGENYLRTPVKTGGHSGDFVEIVDGLYSGDIVVTTPVSQLWLAELRLTKGGGHSH